MLNPKESKKENKKNTQNSWTTRKQAVKLVDLSPTQGIIIMKA